MEEKKIEQPIRAIIGLGNPGAQYRNNRHNIGFIILDALADIHNGLWNTKNDMQVTEIVINNQPIILIKPQTFMNDSGRVIPYLIKQGIKAENVLVVHDELELPFGQIKYKFGGSHKGHNGLRSIISVCGSDFGRLRFGIGRPEVREQVPNYVLQNFKEDKEEVNKLVESAVKMIEDMIK